MTDRKEVQAKLIEFWVQCVDCHFQGERVQEYQNCSNCQGSGRRYALRKQ